MKAILLHRIQRSRTADVVICTVLFTVGFALVVPAIAGNGILGRHPSDGTRLFYFIREYLLGSLASERLPLWNPFTQFGQPFFANMLWSVFYPLNLPLIPLRPEVAYNVFIGLHLGMGGLFMYLLARSWRLDRSPAVVAAIAYMLNGQLVSYAWGGVVNHVSTVVWLPLVLLFFDRAITSSKNRVGWSVGTGAVFGIQVLSGHPQYTFFTGVVLATAAVLRSLELHRQGVSPVRALAPLWILGFVVVSGAALAAVQLIPTYEFANLSTRRFAWGFTWPLSPIEGSYNPVRLATWVVPDLFGNPVSLRPAATDWLSLVLKEVHSNEFRVYFGILPLALAAYAVSGWRASPRIRLLTVLALVGLLLALGGLTPLYGFQYAALPPLRSFRIPARFLTIVVFAGSLLAGFGAQALLHGPARAALRWGRAMLTAAAAILIGVLGATLLRSRIVDVGQTLAAPVFASHSIGQTITSPSREQLVARSFNLAWRGSVTAVGFIAATGVLFLLGTGATHGKRVRLLNLALVGLTALDLGVQAMPYTSFERMDQYWSSDTLLVNALRRARGDGRVLVLPREDGQTRPDLLRPSEQVFMRYRLLAAGGYDPFELKPYGAAYDSIARDLSRGSSQLAAVFGVRFVVTDLPLPPLLFRPLATLGTATLYETEGVLPRAYLALESRPIARPEDAITALKTADLPAGLVVFVEGPELRPIIPQRSGHESIGIMVSEPERLVLAVQSKQVAMLVLNDVFYPGWVAKVDGVSTPIFRANGLVRAIPVPAGTHTVELRFAPRTLILGASISLCTALALLGAAAAALTHAKRSVHENSDDRPSATTS